MNIMIEILLIFVLPVHLSSCAIRSKTTLTPQDQKVANIDHFPFKPEATELYLVGEIDYVSIVTRDFITTTELSLTGIKFGDGPKPPKPPDPSGLAGSKGGPSTLEPVQVKKGDTFSPGASRPPTPPPPGLGVVPPRKTISAPSMPIVKKRGPTPVHIGELRDVVPVKHPSSLEEIEFHGNNPVVVVINSERLRNSLNTYNPKVAGDLSARQWDTGQSFVYDMGEHKVLYTVVGSSDQALTLYGLKVPKDAQSVPSITYSGITLHNFRTDDPFSLGHFMETTVPIAKGNQGEVFFIDDFVVKRSYQGGSSEANEVRMTALAAEIGVGPKIYAAWNEGLQTFMIQQRLRGKTLHALYGKSTEPGIVANQIPDAIQSNMLANIESLSGMKVVHGDLHGGNIMIDGLDVRLLDFGTSRVVTEVNLALKLNLEKALHAIAEPKKNAPILFEACIKANGCGLKFEADHFSYKAK